ncbi:MAG: hypothetical protein WC620_08710 [Methanoregula sp.]
MGTSAPIFVRINDSPYILQSRKPVFAIDMRRWEFRGRGRALTIGATKRVGYEVD